MLRSITLLGTLAALGSSLAVAGSPYTPSAGTSAPMEKRSRSVVDTVTGTTRLEVYEARPAADSYGNAQGNQHDLAVDGAFEGQTVAVLQLYVDSAFDFALPKAALAEKGFSTYRWIHAPPPADELRAGLAKSSQLWIISGAANLLTPAHVGVIKEFYDAGHGVYIWGDNEPYYADANVVAQALLGTQMHGNLMGDQTVGMLGRATNASGVRSGIQPNHLLSTGLEHIYEGITIATIDASSGLEPLIYGSAGNLVAAYHDKDGKRAILDGGFTRLYMKWDTAGTARYVKNAAAWLVNAERFGDAVLSPKLAKRDPIANAERVPAELDHRCPSAFTPRAGRPETFTSARTGYILLALLAGLALLLYLPRRFR